MGGRATGKSHPWLKCFRPQPTARTRLVCFPFAGGGANIYRRWPDVFPTNLEIHAVQLPGREARLQEDCAQTAADVSNAVIAELLGLSRQLPLILFGHSMGSLLAYDAALRLKTHYAQEPRALCVSGRQAPHVRFGGSLHLQPDARLIEEIKRFNGTPAAVFEDTEMRNIVLPMLRGDYKLLETYRAPAGVLTCPIITCIGDRDSEAAPGQMKAWCELTQGPCSHQVLPGGHFYINDRLAELADMLMRSLGMVSAV